MTQLSLTGKQWVSRSETLCTVTDNGSALVDRLLKERSLESYPLDTDVIFPDMQKAVERVRKAVRNKERVAIFGDYDCDGVTATAQMVRLFRRRGVSPLVRLPHRVRDGYGLKSHVVEEFLDAKIDLLITVDTGISSSCEIQMLQESGVDVIVMDHHALPAERILAYAILHPQLCRGAGEDFSPCGAGVVFSFISVFEEKQWEGFLEDLSFASIGTIADVVPLSGWNRRLVQRGLEAMRNLRDCPLATLLESVLGSRFSVLGSDIAFRVAPRINAAGRMDDPIIALRALLYGGEDLLALEDFNNRRQQKTQDLLDVWEHACAAEADKAPFLFHVSPSYHLGIVGLIAGRITERYGKPSCIGVVNGDMCTASLRSPAHFDVTAALRRTCADLCLSFGGHAQAAGCTFLLQHAKKIHERLLEDARSHIATDIRPTFSVDARVSLNAISLDLCATLQRLEPFGAGNPQPHFLVPDVGMQNLRSVGKDGAHLQGRLGSVKCIGFHFGKFHSSIPLCQDLLCTLEIDTWGGRPTPQIFIKDIRASQTGTSVPSISNTSVTSTPNAAAIL